MWRGATSPFNFTSLHYIMLTNAIVPRCSISFGLTSTFDGCNCTKAQHCHSILQKPSRASTWALDFPQNKPAMTYVMLFLSSSSMAGGTRNSNAIGCRLRRLFCGCPRDAPKQRWSVPLCLHPSGIQLCLHFISCFTPASHESDDKQQGIECKHMILTRLIVQWQKQQQNGCDNSIWCQQAPHSFHIMSRECNNEQQGTISCVGVWCYCIAVTRWRPQ